MSQEANLVEALKRVLKLKGVTYSDLAKALELSEASVKRIFAEKTFTLNRLEEVCEVVGLSFLQLAKMAERQTDPDTNLLTEDQEKELAADPNLMSYFYLLMSGLTPVLIRKDYTFTLKEEMAYLKQLEKLGLIEVHSGDHVRLRVTRLVKWNLEGPLMTLYRQKLREEFFASKFADASELLRLIPGKLSASSFQRLRQKVNRLLEEYNELVEVDADLQGKDVQDIALIVAYRPYRFSILDRKRKK